MNKGKRKILRVVGKLGIAGIILPNQWTQPIVKSLILPAHAQTSETAAPTVSNIQTSVNTDMVEPGSIVSLSAVISDPDSALSDLTWTLKANSTAISTGAGQFSDTDYTVMANDGPTLVIELEVRDESNNTVTAELYSQTVGTAAPNITGIEAMANSPMVQVGTVISLKAVIEDIDSELTNISWTLTANGSQIGTGTGQFPDTDYTVEAGDGPNLLIELEAKDEADNTTKAELYSQAIGTVAPTISGIEAMVNTPMTEVGSIISLKAVIADADTDLSAISWTLTANGTEIAAGTGQFSDTDYTIQMGDDPQLAIDLEARDDSGNSAMAQLFSGQVLSCENFPARDSFVPNEYLFDDPNRGPNDPPLSLSEIQALNGEAGNLFFANTSTGGIAGSSELTSTARQALDVIATAMIANPGFTFSIEGHAAECGTNEDNIALGQARSQAVLDYITGRGVPSQSFSTVSFGEERPFCLESTLSCWQTNSRARMVLTGRP